MKFIEVEKVDDELLEKIAERIRKVVDPVKIILFGSYAHGSPSKDSDLDILVIVDNLESTRRALRLKIRKALREFRIPKDIIVVTKEDVKNWKDVPQAFITSVMRKGRVLYERQN
ncbi:nucleotidyltransferase domain-containing protein [Desulfurobacterium sp.]|uniref:nucleotidyltransferase domain-containing protein n=1 Tax=Desulfurobacterium sp. TaxID=2004706 RepID=UPI0026137C78|nr:nucleotidyltransferase domain-containing protein [Desulfurobacterium sp.]